MTLIRWPGGKQVRASTIVAICNTVYHTCFAEDFFGTGGVFFSKPAVDMNILNDLNEWPSLMFETLRVENGTDEEKKERFEEFLSLITPILRGRDLFEKLKQGYPWSDKKPIVRAANLIVLSDLSFGGIGPWCLNRGFAGFHSPVIRENNCSIGPGLDKLHKFFRQLQKNITFEHDDFANVMRRYDHKRALHFLDPPYLGTSTGALYSETYTDERFIEAVERMRESPMIVTHGETLLKPLKELGFIQRSYNKDYNNLQTKKYPDYLSTRIPEDKVKGSLSKFLKKGG